MSGVSLDSLKKKENDIAGNHYRNVKFHKILRVKTIKHCICNTGLHVQQWFVTKVTRMKNFWENNKTSDYFFFTSNVNKCTEKLPVNHLYLNIYMKLKKTCWNHGTWLTCCVRNCPPLSRRQHIIVNYVTHFCEIPSFAWRCGNSRTNNRLRYTLGSVTAVTILLLTNILFVTSWRQFQIPK